MQSLNHWTTRAVLFLSGGAAVKNPPANIGDVGDTSSISGWARSPGEGNGNPFQYCCLGSLMDGEAWRATVHGMTESETTE